MCLVPLMMLLMMHQTSSSSTLAAGYMFFTHSFMLPAGSEVLRRKDKDP